jgi:hypothetical protein
MPGEFASVVEQNKPKLLGQVRNLIRWKAFQHPNRTAF